MWEAISYLRARLPHIRVAEQFFIHALNAQHRSCFEHRAIGLRIESAAPRLNSAPVTPADTLKPPLGWPATTLPVRSSEQKYPHCPSQGRGCARLLNRHDWTSEETAGGMEADIRDHVLENDEVIIIQFKHSPQTLPVSV
jgi:hypothetical protein